MRLQRALASAALMTSVALVGAASIATTAGAAVPQFWVAHTATVAGNGTSCTRPGFNTVQAALSAAPSGAAVHVCSGTYAEQLTITKAVTLTANGPVTMQLPGSPADSVTACEVPTTSDPHYQDEVDICTSGLVTLNGFGINANWPGSTCNDDLYAVFVGGGATLHMNNDDITAAGAVPLNGCQGGLGLEVGAAWTSPVQVGHAVLNNVEVSGYQKLGIAVDGAGSTAKINKTTVTGIGATSAIAQYGIQISNGALGKISNSVVSGNECDATSCGSDALTSVQSTGVLFYAAASGSSVTASTLSDNDAGVYVLADPSASAPTHSIANFATSTFSNNRYAGIEVDQGWVTLRQNHVSGSPVGIVLLQYNGQTFGVKGTATKQTITGATTAVEVRSDVDPGDVAGSFSVTNSSLGGGAVVNQNPSKFTLHQANNTP